MINHNEIEEIKKLIQNGFDIELISFELDIPLEEIQQIKKEIDEQKQSTNIKKYSYSEIVSIRNEEAHKKIEQIREKYRNLYFKGNEEKKVKEQVENVIPKELSAEEVEIINSSITTIQNILAELKNFSPKNTSKSELIKKKMRSAKEVIVEIKKIQNYQLTIEQAEQLTNLLNAKELKGITIETTNNINRYQKIIDIKLAEAVNMLHYQTEDIEELRELGKKLTIDMVRRNQISVGAVKSRINNKISKIQQNKALQKIRNNIPENILGIINDLVNGTVDIEKANEIIEKEAKKRVDSKPKTNFTLTEQQEKNQILIQIGIAIRDKADQFHIIDPETTIFQIQKLCGDDLGHALRIVVGNLISVGNLEEAKEICAKYDRKNNESTLKIEIRNLKLLIRNAEIRDIVLKCINMQGTKEEERKYFELIEKGIKMENVKLETISLGKSQDGQRNITLADIWTDDKQR